MKIKLNDVYRFQFNETELKHRSYPYHCFDGQLTVKEGWGKGFRLYDSYWNFSGNCTKSFTLEEALKYGTLEFICNMDEIEPIEWHQQSRYDDADLFDLSNQHGCYKKMYKRIGAQPSKQKMISVLNKKIEEEKSKIKMAASSLRWLNQEMIKLEKAEDVSQIYV